MICGSFAMGAEHGPLAVRGKTFLTSANVTDALSAGLGLLVGAGTGNFTAFDSLGVKLCDDRESLGHAAAVLNGKLADVALLGVGLRRKGLSRATLADEPKTAFNAAVSATVTLGRMIAGTLAAKRPRYRAFR